MDDNFTYHPCNFNAVTEGQMLFVSEGHNFNPSTAHNPRSVTLFLCYIQTLEPNI